MSFGLKIRTVSEGIGSIGQAEPNHPHADEEDNDNYGIRGHAPPFRSHAHTPTRLLAPRFYLLTPKRLTYQPHPSAAQDSDPYFQSSDPGKM
jgi:hypothetical protein